MAIDFSECVEFINNRDTSTKYRAIDAGDDKITVMWDYSGDCGVGSLTYRRSAVDNLFARGIWKLVNDSKPQTVYQVGFSDGTWRDVSEVTFNEAKTWSSTHATRIIQVI